MDERQIVQAVHQDLCGILLKEEVPPKTLAVNLWDRAILQYTLSHHQRLAQVKNALADLTGLYLCSNYIDGVVLGYHVSCALNQAKEVENYLQTDERK